MGKLKELTTIVFGELGEKLNGYQQEKLAQQKLLKQLLKILRKYWQLANNTEIVYQIMDNISGDLKYKVLIAAQKDNILPEDQALYNRAMEIFKLDVRYKELLKEYEKAKEEHDDLEKKYTKTLPLSFLKFDIDFENELKSKGLLVLNEETQKYEYNFNNYADNIEELLKLQRDLDSDEGLDFEFNKLKYINDILTSKKEEISVVCKERLRSILSTIDQITDRIERNEYNGDEVQKDDDRIKYNYYTQWKKHRQYLLKLNNLGVDIKLTVDVLKADIDKIKDFISKLQEVIDSFAGGPVNPLVGKFNKRLKQFTRRLLEIVTYINDNYPNIEFELNADDHENKLDNEIFNNDIIDTDEGDASIRRYYDIDINPDGTKQNDGVDADDVAILKKIIKLIAKGKISNADKARLVHALDTNGDGVLDKVDLQWLESYVQDAEEIEYMRENNSEQTKPYKDVTDEIDEETQAIINKVTDPNYKGEKYSFIPHLAPKIIVHNNSTDIFNLVIEPVNVNGQDSLHSDVTTRINGTPEPYYVTNTNTGERELKAYGITGRITTNKYGTMRLDVNNGMDEENNFVPFPQTQKLGASFDLNKKLTYYNIKIDSSNLNQEVEFTVFYLCDENAYNEAYNQETGEVDESIFAMRIYPNLVVTMYDKEMNDKEFVFNLPGIPSIYTSESGSGENPNPENPDPETPEEPEITPDLEVDYESDNGQIQIVSGN